MTTRPLTSMMSSMCVTLMIFTVTFYIAQAIEIPPRRTEPPTIVSNRMKGGKDKVYFDTEKERGQELLCRALGSQPIEFEWTKNGNPLDIRDPMYMSNKTQTSKIVSVDEGTGTILITELKDTDEGTYQCVATNKYGTSMSRIIRLKQAKKNSFDTYKVQRYKPYPAQSLKIPCNPPENDPPGRVKWIQNMDDGDEQRDVWQNERISIDDEGNLHFANVQQMDENEGRQYICILEIAERGMLMMGSFSVIEIQPGNHMAAIPTELVYSSKDKVIALKGEIASFSCIFSGNPTPTITWRRINGVMHDRRMIKKNQRLKIRKIKYEDAGTYECRGTNPHTRQAKSKSFKLEIESKPEWTSEPRKVDAGDEESATFECAAEGRPMVTIQWYINGNPLESLKTDSRRFLSNGQLRFVNLTINDAQVIQCNASNLHGYLWADVALSIMAFKPEINAKFDHIIKITEDQRVVLPCETAGKPNPSIYWKRSGQKIEGPRYQLNPTGNLTIAKTILTDTGEWTCYTENKYGKENSTGRLVVRKPLTAPSNLELVPDTHVTSDTAEFQWDPVDTTPEMIRGEFRGYKVRFWKKGLRNTTQRIVEIPRSPENDNRVERYQITKEQVKVLNLPNYSDLEADVVAHNTYFDSNSSNTVNFTTLEGVPGPVKSVRVLIRGYDHFDIEWEKPQEPNGILTGYKTGYVEVYGFALGELQPAASYDEPERITARLDGLKENMAYRVYVWAMTRVGQGEELFIDIKTTVSGMLLKPKAEVVVVGEDFVNVTWIIPTDTNLPGGKTHFIKYRKLGDECWIYTDDVQWQRWIIVSGLASNTQYELAVVAESNYTQEMSKLQLFVTEGEDTDECSNNNGGCDQTCTNMPGSYRCGCTTGYNLHTDGQTCLDINDCVGHECTNGGTCLDGLKSYMCVCGTGYTGTHCEQGSSSSMKVFKRLGLPGKRLPRGCFTLLLYSRTNNIEISSTSDWFSSTSDTGIMYTFGVVYVNVIDSSIPISLNGIKVRQNEDSIHLDRSIKDLSQESDAKIGNRSNSVCISLNLTSTDIFSFVSANSFFESFIYAISPLLPEWLHISSNNQSVLNTQDLQTKLIYGSEIDKTIWCKGAPVMPSYLYNAFIFSSSFTVNIYGDTLIMHSPLNGQKFCVMVDVSQDSRGTIFIMFPGQSGQRLTELRIFKTLFEQQHVVIIPRGIGLSVDNGIELTKEDQDIQLWNGDQIFNYDVFETADVWMSADISKSVSIFKLKTSATFYIDVSDVNKIWLGLFWDEWDTLAKVNSDGTLELHIQLMGKSYSINLSPLITVDVNAYLSFGEGETPRQLCGETANPAGIFFSAVLRINPFQGIPFLENMIPIDRTHTVYVFLATDPVSTINTEIDLITDTVSAIIYFDEQLKKISKIFNSNVQQFERLISNETEQMLLDIKHSFKRMNDIVSLKLIELTIGNTSIENSIDFLKQIWSEIKASDGKIDIFLDAVEFDVDIHKDCFVKFLKTESNLIHHQIENIIQKFSRGMTDLGNDFKGFGFKYSMTMKIFDFSLSVDFEFIYNVNSLGKCSRFDQVYKLFEGEEVAHILGSVRSPKIFGRFLKFIDGVGIGGAVAINSPKWVLQLQVFATFFKINVIRDIFISSDNTLRTYIEGNIWGTVFAQIDISTQLGGDAFELRYRLEGKLVAKSRDKRQIRQSVSTSFQDSYLDALKSLTRVHTDEANTRLNEAQELISIVQNGLTKAHEWLDDRKTDVRSLNNDWDNAIETFKLTKKRLEAAKTPFEKARKQLEDAQKNVDKLCKIQQCRYVCIPGPKCKWCRAGGWLPYPCCEFTSCLFKIHDIICEVANLICRGVRAIAYIALEAANIFVKIPILALDIAKTAVSVAQIVVDKSRIVLDIAVVALDVAQFAVEQTNIRLELAKLALEGVKLIMNEAVHVLEFVIEYGLKSVFDVKNCGFSIEISTTDLSVFDVSCEINPLNRGWRTIRLRINFLNIAQSIWQASKSTVNAILKEIGNFLGKRKRREVLFKSVSIMHKKMREIRETDQFDFTNTTGSFLNESIDISGNTFGENAKTMTNFDSKVLLFKGKCYGISKVNGFLHKVFETLFEIANDLNSNLKEATEIMNSIENSVIVENVVRNMTLEDLEININSATHEFNLTMESVQMAINTAKTDALTDPLMLELNPTAEYARNITKKAVSSIETFSLLAPWINEMDNVTKEYFDSSDCRGLQDCLLFSIFTLYDLFIYEDHPQLSIIKTAVDVLEDNILELFSNATQNISSIFTTSAIIKANIGIISKNNYLCTTPPTLGTPLSNQTVVRSTNTTMRCPITANPQPNYWWFKNEFALAGDVSEILVFVNTTDEHEGVYRCMAGNIIGNVTSNEVYLRVIDKIPATDVSQNNIVMLIGIVCGAGTLVISVAFFAVVVHRRRRLRRRNNSSTNTRRTQNYTDDTYEG